MKFRGKQLPLDRSIVMAIVNRTTDSFYDAGRTYTLHTALDRVDQVVDEGADIVDIGGVKAAPSCRGYGLLPVPDPPALRGRPRRLTDDQRRRIFEPCLAVQRQRPDRLLDAGDRDLDRVDRDARLGLSRPAARRPCSGTPPVRRAWELPAS
jgi:hypothetical protein